MALQRVGRHILLRYLLTHRFKFRRSAKLAVVMVVYGKCLGTMLIYVYMLLGNHGIKLWPSLLSPQTFELPAEPLMRKSSTRTRLADIKFQEDSEEERKRLTIELKEIERERFVQISLCESAQLLILALWRLVTGTCTCHE